MNDCKCRECKPKLNGLRAEIVPHVATPERLEPPPPVETILEEAQRLVHGNRGADYGHPIDDYTRTGRMWAAIIDGWLSEQPGFENMPPVPDIDPRIGCLMMAAVKLSREVNKHKRDNLTDAAGYSECAQMVAERQGL